jgi:Fanconi anemia group M protein
LKEIDVDIKYSFLDIGDYVFPNAPIERKKDDIVQSILSKRIFEQLRNLKEYDNPVLVITTPNLWKLFYFRNHRRDPYIHKAYFGMLASCILDFGIPVIRLDDDDEFVEFIYYMAKNLQDSGNSSVPVIKAKRGMPINKKKIHNLAQTDGLGYAKAKMLLDNNNGSFMAVISKTEKELMQYEGIGKILAKRIKEEWS